MRRRLPKFVLRQEHDRDVVVIRAMTTAKAFQKPDPMAWMDAHRAVPGELGYIKLSRVEKTPMVEHVRVRAELHRSGLGTKLYEAAAKAACELFEHPLVSDEKRSAADDGFWQKQVRKGRARCVRKLKMSAWDRDFAPPEKSIFGRSGCAFYQLKACPAPVSLAGRKR